MANDTTLVTTYPTGATLYTQIVAPDNTAYNGTAFVPLVVASWGTFAVSTPETPSASGIFVAQFPIASAAGNYRWRVYLRAGGSPASTDICVGTGGGFFDGTTFGGSSSVTGNVAGSVASVTGNVGGNVAGSVNSVVSGVSSNVIHAGTARGGTASTITLDTGASAVDNTYQNCLIQLTGGTGSGQVGAVQSSGYVGSTRVATMTTPWATTPDGTTTFNVLPQGAVVMGQLGGANRTVTQDWNGVGSLAVKSATTGLPIAGAILKAYLASAYAADPAQAQVYATVVTDASGGWSMSLAPAAYTVTISLSGTPTVVSDTFPLTVN